MIPLALVESGVIGANGERIPDAQPYWRKPVRRSVLDWLRAFWRQCAPRP